MDGRWKRAFEPRRDVHEALRSISVEPTADSRVVSIPDDILSSTTLGTVAELTVENSTIVIRPVSQSDADDQAGPHPRDGWEAVFDAAFADETDEFSDERNLSNDFDETEWTWEELDEAI